MIVLLRADLFYSILIWIFTLLTITLSLFTYFSSGSTLLFDLNTRLNLNDSLLNSFNFFWTSFTYLPLFFFTTLFIYLPLSNLHSKLLAPIPIIVLYFSYSFESFDFLVLNYHPHCFNLNYPSINLLLSNNLNKYHPFIFYTSIFFIATPPLWFFFCIVDYQLFVGNRVGVYHPRRTLFTLIINLTALFLGSWWALQEGTWGGWWNWDASEVLGLLVSLYSLYNIHSSTLTTSISQWGERSLLLTLVIILSYYFIQLNFDLVSHNFGSKFFFFFNNNFFFLEIISLVLIAIFVFSYKYYILKSQLISTLGRSILQTTLRPSNWVHITILYLVVLVILLSSFLPLINYFVWSYFNINSFNFYIFLPSLISFVSLALLFTFTHHNNQLYYITFLISSGLYSAPLLSLLLTLTLNYSVTSVLHVSLSSLALINLTSYYLSFIQWSDYLYFQEVIISTTPIFLKQVSYVCDTFLVEKLFTYRNGTYIETVSWNTFYLSNTTSVNSFLLNYDTSTLYNLYTLADGWTNPSLLIELNLLNNLLELLSLTTTISMLVLYYIFGRRQSNY